MKKAKIAIVMKEFKKGSLKSSSGQKVTNPKQALAISLSEARRANEGGMMGKLFGGKESYKEEFGEAKAVAKRKITPAQFARGEKSEGHKGEEMNARQTGEKIRSGKLSPADYAKSETTGEKKMAKGGMSGFPVKRKGGADKKTVALLANKILDAKMGAAPMAPPMAPPMMPPGMKKGGSVKKMAAGGMPDQSNSGGAMRGLDRAAAMSGRNFSGMGRPAGAGTGSPTSPPVLPAQTRVPSGVVPGGMKKGGSVSKRADGVAVRGRTDPKVVKMAAGGFARSADGIAQRGRTKVKMLNKGGRVI